jgi:hypothetical protein
MMKMTILIAAVTLLGLSIPADAGHFDGKKPLLCSIYQLFECDHPNGCVTVTPAEVLGVSHLNIDFRNKVMTRAGIESGQSSAIQSSDTIDNKLIIQGIEDGEEDERDGAGWTISIMDPEGTMTMAVAGDGFGIMGLGACVPQP